MAREEYAPKTSRFMALASICVVVAALYFAREVLVPISVAILFTFLLAPVVHIVERWHAPRPLAVLSVVCLALLVVGAIGFLIYNQASDLAGRLPEYQSDIEKKVTAIQSHFGHGAFARASETIDKVAKDVATQPSAEATKTSHGQTTAANPIPVVVTSTSNPSDKVIGLMNYAMDVLSPLGTVLIIIVFVIFMLLQREDMRDRLIRLVGHGQLTVTTKALDDAGRRVSRYLLAQSGINFAYAIIVTIGLFLLKIPNAPLWGLLCGLLRFIPYLGVWIGAACPIILSLVVPGGYAARPFLTIGMFVAIELIVSNAIEPWLYASSTGVSSVAILAAAVFWTWLWGGVGLLLSTPLTVVLAVMGKYVPQMQFLTVLLGDEPVLKPHERYYQRLLAEDPEEANDMVDEFLKTHTHAEAYSQILLPALQMAERDHARGALDDPQRDFIRDALRDEVESLREQAAAKALKAEAAKTEAAAKDTQVPQDSKPTDAAKPFMLPKDCALNILCLPAHDVADEVAGDMLAHLLQEQGYHAKAVSTDALASEMVDMVASTRADVVVVSAMPPGAVAHARYLCKRIHAKHPDMRMIVGLWTAQGDLDRAKQRIACDESVRVSAQFEHGLDLIHQMIQPLLIRENALENSPNSAPANSSPQPATAQAKA